MDAPCEDDQRLFVVTGGPGSGKTSLLAALHARGIATTEEAGRAIIRDQLAIGGRALPWADTAAFAEAMLAFDMRTYHAAETRDGPIVFDRGIPDIIGYRRLAGLPVPADLTAAARRLRYNARVFVAPPWREIFAQDDERRQSFAEAEATYRMMVEVYREHGYGLIELPRASIEARAAFVVDEIRRATDGGSAKCT